MSTLNTAKASKSFVSCLNTYDATVFGCAFVGQILSEEGKTIKKELEVADTKEKKDDALRRQNINDDRKKAVRAYEKETLLGDSKKSLAGLVDHFVGIDFEKLLEAKRDGKFDSCYKMIRDCIQPFFPEGTSVNELTGFAKKIAMTIGTVKAAGGKGLLEGKRTKEVTKAEYFKVFAAALTEQMAKNKKSGVVIHSENNSKVTYEFDSVGGKITFKMTVSLVETKEEKEGA